MYKKIFILLIIAIIVFASGLYFGYNKGARQGANAITSTYDESISIKLKNEIKLLKQLREGDIDTVTSTLETLVDTDISYLGVKILKANTTEKDILEALRDAKEYRQKYPDHKPNKVLSKTIEETFQRISKQP